MQPRHRRVAQRSASVGAPTMYIEVECYLRAAGRGLEVLGVTDAESARLAGVVFRLAQQRVRSDRLERSA